MVIYFLDDYSVYLYFFLSAIIYPWMAIGLPPRCPQVVWCHWVERSHFLSRRLRIGWQRVISQGKIPWNTPPWLGAEPGPQGGQIVSYCTELSWLALYIFRGIFFIVHQGWKY